MAKQVTINDSKSFIPSGYVSGSNITTNTTYPASNGYNGVSNTSNYARLQLSASNTSTDCYGYYTFNVQGIPSNATITSVSCIARVYLNNRVGSATLQLYSNTTAKGSSTTFSNTSANNITLSNTGSWTVSELSNLRLRIQGRRSLTNNSSYIYFYGADITINYSVNTTAYEITSISNTDLVESIVPEGTTDVMSGDSYTLNVYADTFGDFIVEDNGVDVTNQLVQREITDTGGTINAVALSNYDTEFSSNGAQFYASGSNTGPVNGVLAIGYTAESPNPDTPTGNSVGNYMYVKDSSGGGSATGSLVFNFDFSSIPENAIIESVSISAYGCQESDSSSSNTDVCKLGAYSGSVLKGSEQDITRTSNGITTMSNVGTWTRQELQNAKLKFTVGYYGGRLGGITWSVTYSIPSTTQYYWEYTLSNVSADHTIYVKEPIVIPPDEDPTVTYYPITISSINATTTPGKGTTRVESGTSETITITPSDPQLTLALDNGVDITSQLVQHGGTIPDPTITTASGASYGFNLNSSTGYYVSQNTGIDKSAAVARVLFNLPVRCLVTINFINYAEASYDFGVFGNIDTSLNTNYYAAGRGGATITDTSYKLACNNSSYNTSSVQSLTYEIESGEHYIDIKYSKDDATGSNNDSLQWKITSIEPLESVVGYYTYDLSNISQEHSLIFIFGDVTYYFVNSSTNSDCTLYPNGQMVQLPGDSYRLTIVPKNSSDSITLRDNNVDVTSQLERKEVTTEKDGQTITVVNYIYRLSNIQATHNLVVSSALQQLSSSIKLNNQWNEGELKRKQDSRWGTLSYTRIWVHNGTAWVENAQRTITTNGMIFGGVINNGGE